MKKLFLAIFSASLLFSFCAAPQTSVKEGPQAESKIEAKTKPGKKPESFYSFHYQGKAKEVFLAGNFNNWRQKDSRFQMTSKDGLNWDLKVSETLLKKGRNEYKVIADGEWKIDLKSPVEESGLSGKINVLVIQ